jgi:hypothetical protein
MARIVVGSSNLTQPLLLYSGLGPAMLEQHRRSSLKKITRRLLSFLAPIWACLYTIRNCPGPCLTRWCKRLIIDSLGGKENSSLIPEESFLSNLCSLLCQHIFLTIFKLPKWGFARIGRFRRSFLWKGQNPDNIKGGHCLDNWQTCLRPKRLGGLGFKDLEKFSRALRLRWLWHNWDSCDKPWKYLLKITDAVDRELFFNSTTIRVGNDRNTLFWEAR